MLLDAPTAFLYQLYNVPISSCRLSRQPLFRQISRFYIVQSEILNTTLSSIYTRLQHFIKRGTVEVPLIKYIFYALCFLG